MECNWNTISVHGEKCTVSKSCEISYGIIYRHTPIKGDGVWIPYIIIFDRRHGF